ncbi:hypothetical protein F7725_024213 [Dissostichus mawsoni]|uniref:ADF-H domain-containing protein n=1 Tax=Dissostichus mawsoni TaxID=36200 RepID=A0A7J5XYT6_DISMA|nr:hypothetical protein F7725_024213 [Dissostichus mawsoni]
MLKASGVKVADEVKQIFNAMKVVKSDDDEKERIRIVVLHIDVEIKVEKIYRQKDLEDVEDVYKFVKNLMLADQCRYFLYDCHFETKEGIKKEELLLLSGLEKLLELGGCLAEALLFQQQYHSLFQSTQQTGDSK